MGRPTLCDAQAIERIEAALLDGADDELAASHAGVSVTSFYAWQKKGRAALEAADGDLDAVPDRDNLPVYAQFAERVREARNHWMLERIASIQEAGRGYEATKVTEKFDGTGKLIERTVVTTTERDWRADVALLERRFPARWGRTTRHEHSGPGGGDIPLSGLSSVEEAAGNANAKIDELAGRRAQRAAGE